MPKDTLYARPHDRIVDFVFDEHVVTVFDDMIQRSVPGYATVVAMTGVLAQQYAQADTRCYDLGCSLGAVTLAMRRCIDQPIRGIVAVDNSAPMVERCRANVARDGSPIPVELICADMQAVELLPASVVVLNFTLQFVAPEARLALLRKIREALVPGGVLILSEKVRFADPVSGQFFSELHHEFKRANGYSDLEISQKRTALENVLRPDTIEDHRARLSDAGFSRSELWFQCLNFVSLIAFR